MPPSPNIIEPEAARVVDALLALGRVRSLRDPIALTLTKTDLTPPQLHAIFWLGHDGSLTMGELSRRLGVTVKAITGVVDRIEQAGLAERIRDAQDRRVIRVRVTAKGASLHRRLDKDLQVKLSRLLEFLTAEDRRDLFRIFNHLRQRLESKQ